MGLSLDLTMLVQAINFAIAYVAIRTLLLKPAVETLEKNAEHQQSLNHKIDVAIRSNEAQEKHMQEQWQLYRIEVKEKMPTPVITPLITLKRVSEKPVIPVADKEYTRFLTASIAEELVKRIDHVRI